MLQINLPEIRFFDERTEEFVFAGPVTLKLEHSLISLHKWESKWHKSYLHAENLTSEEILDYIRCMSLDPNLDIKVLERLTRANLKQIEEYIQNPMTATTFNIRERKSDKTILTAEVLYYYMINFGIPFECAKWHLNQLFALIQVCSLKSAPSKKVDKKEAAATRAALNRARRARTGSKG